MSLGEMVAWAGLGMSVLLTLLLVMLAMRLRRVERQFRALTGGAGPGAVNMSLGELISSQGARLDATYEEVAALRKAVASLDNQVTKSVQCVGLVRYNPFQDTGGDQSFALALLDKQGDGVVVSSLHGRTATRFYAKPIKGGSSPLSLSEEEVEALNKAMAGLKRET